MLRLLVVLLRGLRSALRSHANLALENLALRQQLALSANVSETASDPEFSVEGETGRPG